MNPNRPACVHRKQSSNAGKIENVMVHRFRRRELWLVRAGLVTLCPAWGALATLMVIQHASAARDVAAADLKVATAASGNSGIGASLGTLSAAAGSDAFAGLEAGIVVAALVMAADCGWGLTRRLAEYRWAQRY